MKTREIEAWDIHAGDYIYMSKAIRDLPGSFSVKEVKQSTSGVVNIKTTLGRDINLMGIHKVFVKVDKSTGSRDPEEERQAFIKAMEDLGYIYDDEGMDSQGKFSGFQKCVTGKVDPVIVKWYW